jgi:hypothetical protein
MGKIVGLFISRMPAPVVGHLFPCMEAIMTDLRATIDQERGIRLK